MRFRLLAFLPIAFLMTMLCLFSASTLVSAVEPPLGGIRSGSIDLRLYETSCDVLARELRELGRRATSCDRDLLCLDSPILCPVLFEKEEAREYARLQARYEEGCTGRFSEGAASRDAQRRFMAETADCDFREARGESNEGHSGLAPATFVF